MKILPYVFVVSVTTMSVAVNAAVQYSDTTFKAGHKSLKQWILPDTAPHPKDNVPNKARVELGKALFFDTRLSGDGNMSCATCHSPMYGWSDGLPTAKGVKGKILDRASPVVTNTGFNSIQMWDGRKKSLEDQAMGPIEATLEMNMDIPRLFKILNNNEGYKVLFKKAYPGEAIDEKTISKGIATYQRTIVSNTSPVDKWLKGKKKALNASEVNGFKVFMDPNKGSCATCHDGANFTDNGFHNIGLESHAKETPDMGRYAQVPLGIMKGAFKTPTLRDIEYSAPYFHDGSAATLTEVIDHYVSGGKTKKDLSPNMKPLTLTNQEKLDLEAFLKALSSPRKAELLPILPL